MTEGDINFWDSLETLGHELLDREREIVQKRQPATEKAKTPTSENGESGSRGQVLRAIERLTETMIVALSKEQSPVLTYKDRRNSSNVSFDEDFGVVPSDTIAVKTVDFSAIKSTTRFARTLQVLAISYRLVQTNTYSTKRDVFYNNTKLFGSQRVLDTIVDDIACMLNVPRHSLHILATSKGCVAGDLTLVDSDGSFLDCSVASGGTMVPAHVQHITNLHSNAKFVLVVEKDATFQKLLDDGFCRKLAPCIMVTGKGVPDLNTRMLVHKLWKAFHIPVFALVDADPHGMEIMCTYKYGSMALSHEFHSLTVPTLKWLGVLPSDIRRLCIQEDVLLPMNDSDRAKARELLEKPFLSAEPLWKRELEEFLTRDRKAEIQSLISISPTFLTDVYIPNKIKFGGWI
ncbi:PREDICTED: meiotic recombination protein SPO11-like [Branchiostoma belcheri]|uniref:DNA topoisomerase (ATP-hydrolyzing) n=1 Tax=Branchiostoma belcheri TaxID=7741 RepID=A0A6P4Z5T4_BRABE|nr:PREDICTED: meiotic recombination protein SPO11-like [Branchiostoma belcheri]